MIGEDSEDDMVESGTESESEEDLKSMIDRVWKSESPPVTEEELIGKWYAVIVRSNRRKTLDIAKIVHHFLVDPDGPVESLEIRFLMPKYGSGDVIDDIPQHLPDDIGLVKQNDLIAGPLKVECKARERKFAVKDYENIVDFFHKVKDL